MEFFFTSCLINQEKKLDTRTKVAPEELIGRESLMQENLSALDCEIGEVFKKNLDPLD